PEPIVETAAFGAPVVGAGLTVAAAHALVPWADTADVILTSAGRFDPAAVELVPRPSVDGARRVFEVRGEAEPFPGDLHAAYIRGICGNAAQLCGLSDRMLAMTADYVKDREQFGVPVGSFQAVKHHLADARIALEFAQPLVARAAYSLSTADPDAPEHVSMAKAQAGDAAELAARSALQCHGAIGYSSEYDLHLWMKRVWALASSWGDARWHRARVAAAIL
ncbi:MAG: acyl-CoA dehydrogenase family protein, partial [Actinomycetes bacterium]